MDYTVSNKMVDTLVYANLYYSEPMRAISDTVNYCSVPLTGGGINGHYSIGGTSQVEGIELTFGDTGVRLLFGAEIVESIVSLSASAYSERSGFDK